MTTVSTSGFYDSAIFNMNSLRQQANKLQQQISTGNKILNSSDDPVAAAQMRTLQQADAMTTATTAVSNTTKTNLTQADSTLSQFSTIVTQIQTLSTQAANGTLDDSQRASIGTQLSSYYDQLVSLANTKDANGHALFGGQGTGDAYTIDASGNATYSGTASAAQVSLGQGLSVTTGVTGPEFLDFTSNGTQTNLLSTVKNLADALTNSSNGSGATAATAALTTLSDGLNAITTAQTLVGARLSWISTTSSIQTQISQQRTSDESTIGGTDIATAVSQLQQTMTVLEASQASFVKVSGLSLFSMIQ